MQLTYRRALTAAALLMLSVGSSITVRLLPSRGRMMHCSLEGALGTPVCAQAP
jgi:hypothetical protein